MLHKPLRVHQDLQRNMLYKKSLQSLVRSVAATAAVITLENSMVKEELLAVGCFFLSEVATIFQCLAVDPSPCTSMLKSI